jgi:hypothetical protein
MEVRRMPEERSGEEKTLRVSGSARARPGDGGVGAKWRGGEGVPEDID